MRAAHGAGDLVDAIAGAGDEGDPGAAGQGGFDNGEPEAGGPAGDGEPKASQGAVR